MSAILPAVGIFGALGENSRTQLTSLGTTRQLGDAEVLILEGQPQFFLYSVLTGELRVTTLVAGKTVELGRLHFGDCFGEMGMLEQTVASATVTSVGPTMVWSLSSTQFEMFVSQHHLAAAQMLLAIARILGRRLRDANDLIRRHNIVPISLSFRGPGEPVTFETSREGLASRFHPGRR